MLVEYLRYGELHHWAVFCCTIASLGLIGAFWGALFITSGKVFGRALTKQPTVIVVNGGQWVQEPQKRGFGFGRTYLLLAAIFSGGPMLTLLLLAANQAAQAGVHWVGAHWWLLLIGGVLGLTGLIVYGYWRSDARRRRQDGPVVAALPVSQPASVVAAQPMWSLTDYDEREFER